MLSRQILLLETEASFAICGQAGAECLRQEARRLRLELERMKAELLAAEAA